MAIQVLIGRSVDLPKVLRLADKPWRVLADMRKLIDSTRVFN